MKTQYAYTPAQTSQRGELLSSVRAAHAEPELCECGEPCARNSCYCTHCEDRIYADEFAQYGQ